MRVALVGPYPIDRGRVGGGVESAFTGFLSGLVELPATSLHVITFVPGLAAPIRKDVDGVAVDCLPGTSRFGSLTLLVRERRLLARALAALRPDVVHGQETAGYGYVCLKTERVAPVVLNIHGVVHEEVPYARGVDKLRLWSKAFLFQRYCIRHGRYFVQSTPYPEEVFGRRARGVFEDIRNPIEERFFSVSPEPEPGRIVYSGSVIPRKRLLDAIDALPIVLATAPHARLRVAGNTDADPDYARRVRARAHELGVEECVDFLGSLAPDQVLAEYRRASVFVLPSGQETSPLAIGEAMAVGVPVVASNAGGVRHLVEDGSTGFVVEVGDVPALADRVGRVLASEDEQRRLAAASRDRAEHDFRPSEVARRLRAFYERAIDESRGSSG